MDVERQVAVGLKWSSTARLLGQAISWAITLLVVRLLVPADYGVMALSMVVISIVAGVAEFGLGAALVQARSVSRQELARVAGVVVVLNIVSGALVALSAPLFGQLFEDPRVAAVIRVASLQF